MLLLLLLLSLLSFPCSDISKLSVFNILGVGAVMLLAATAGLLGLTAVVTGTAHVPPAGQYSLIYNSGWVIGVCSLMLSHHHDTCGVKVLQSSWTNTCRLVITVAPAALSLLHHSHIEKQYIYHQQVSNSCSSSNSSILHDRMLCGAPVRPSRVLLTHAQPQPVTQH